MKKKLTKSLERIHKENPNLEMDREFIKKLSPNEIKVFRSLQKKYDLNILNETNIKIDQDNQEINKQVRSSLDRINKGLPFVFKK